MSSRLTAIIREVKPRAALLTTYTLSLSYFEAAILSELRQAGCRDIVLLVDEQEARASFAEARSMGAGRTYRLLPVASPGGGIFHPKIAYFECKNDDVLVVASGNLTYAGQGGSLECIDQVRCSEHPGVFEDFADWCHLLQAKLATVAPQAAEQLRVFGKRALAQAKKHGNGQRRNAWLVHNAAESAASTLVRIASEEGPWDELCVLSPFHTPDGAPVLRLAETLEVASLDIGLDPVTEHAALSRKLFKPSLPVRYVLPIDDEENRRSLHAKWFELRAENKSFIMTGSVNATHQSLESLANVEISLARVLPVSPAVWEEATPSGFTPSKFIPAVGRTEFLSFDCSLRKNSRIHVQLHQPIEETSVSIVLECAGQVLIAWPKLAVSKSGEIITPVFDVSNAVFAIAVHLRCGILEGESWLNIEPELAGEELKGGHHEALARLAGGQALPGDSVMFLQLLVQFAVELGNYRAPVAQSAAGHKANDATPDENANFSYKSWKQSGSSRGQNSGPVAYDKLTKALSRIFNLQKSGERNGGPSARGLLNANVESVHESPDAWDGAWAPDYRESEIALQTQLRREIPLLLRTNADHPHAHLLASYLLAEALAHSRSRAVSVPADQAYSACQAWLETCSELKFSESAREELMPLALVLAGWLVNQYASAGMTAPAENYWNSLQRLANKGYPLESLLAMAKEGCEHQLMAWIPDIEREKIIECVVSLTASESVDEVLVGVVRRALGEKAYWPDSRTELMFPGLLAALNAKKNQRKPPFGIMRSLSSCPCCFVKLSSESVRDLQRFLFVVCPAPTCKQVVLNIQNPLLLDALSQGERRA